MASDFSDELKEQLESYGQSHLLRDANRLDAAGRECLKRQLDAIDFPLIAELVRGQREVERSGTAKSESQTLRELASRSGSPANLVRLAEFHSAARQSARETGEQLLKEGNVGAILVAGGQGTRLGFPHPKGMFPIGPVTDRTLFRLFAEQLQARMRRGGTTIPYFIMTSEATHDETVAYFRNHDFLGLNPDDVFFFQQASLPAVDPPTGRILLAGTAEIALSPDGHGGMLAALRRAGLFDVMKSRGIEHLYYHQVDNAATVVCDPVFLGLHVARNSEMSTKVVAKTSGEEPMGVVVGVDGRTRIIEYSDLPKELATEADDKGQLRFWAGSTAIHAFRTDFLERMTDDAGNLPYHTAHKQVAFVDDAGELHEPESPNAWKFERFIFDILPLAENALVMEVERASEFLPVKKEDGPDSPETARAGLLTRNERWLREAGIACLPGIPVEISPLFALDREELGKKLTDSVQMTGPTVCEETGLRSVV